MREEKIYLAGRIARGDWRTTIVSESVVGLDTSDYWAIRRGAILGQHDYTGPFFVDSGGHGFSHGEDSHGVGAGPDSMTTMVVPGYKHAGDSHLIQEEVVARCLAAIRNSTLVFAWIEDKQCYGTLFELGFAKAIGVKTVIAYNNKLSLTRDLWFASTAANQIMASEHPRRALVNLLQK